MMDPLLDVLKKNAREDNATLAKMLDTTEADVVERIAKYEHAGIIRGFQAVLNPNKLESTDVHAVIELRIRPERECGFETLATQIAKFPQVQSVFLMSGAYDLMLFVRGKSLQEVAHFVSAQLSTIDGVLSTATHFMLKTYKDQDVLMESVAHEDDRLTVTP